MEDGELDESSVTEETRKRGEKRNQSVLDDDDTGEETFSIQPPPVATKKHKRHHKKHKTGKEEKKKKRHRRSNEQKIKVKETVIEDPKFEQESVKRRRHDDHISVARIPESIDQSRRREYSNRVDERIPRLSKVDRRSDRSKQYYKGHVDPPDRDYLSNRDDKLHGSSSKYSSRHPPYKPDRQPQYPAKSHSENSYSDHKRHIRREDAVAKPKALLVRRYDDDFDRSRSRDASSRDDRGKHVRSVSSSVTVSSSITHASHSRRSDSALEASYKKHAANERYNDANGHKRSSDDKDPLRKEKRSPMSKSKHKKVIEDNAQINTVVVSSEDSSESSQSEESSSEEEEKEISKRARRKKERKKAQLDESTTTQEIESSSDPDAEEDEEEEEDESSNVESADSAASEANQSASGDSDEHEDEDDDEDAGSEDDDDNEQETGESASDDGDDNDDGYDGETGDEAADVDDPEGDLLGDVEVLSPEPSPESKLPYYYPAIQGCRNVDEFKCLNRIEEGTYGVVYRAEDRRTGEIVALKRLKMEKEREGFPITSLREVSTLLKAHHSNVVRVQEIVVGSNVDKIYIVMDYVEHDLKSLMETMKQPFLVGEVKTLMIQLLRGIHHLHDNWILHRDLKTSNLLLSHKGILKIGDFGLAREYGSPLKPYTPIVVTLWYRSPELLLGVKEYSTAVDMWSVGCIFAEFLSKKPLFPGKSEIMQLNLIFKELGTPSEKIWPGYTELPLVKKTTFTEYPYNTLRKRFGATDISEKGFDLLNRFLTYCPGRRISALASLKHEWFIETPKPVEPSMFPTWPAKSEQTKTRKSLGSGGGTPKAPQGAMGYNKLLNEEEKLGFQLTAPKHGISKHGMGFSLKF